MGAGAAALSCPCDGRATSRGCKPSRRRWWRCGSLARASVMRRSQKNGRPSLISAALDLLASAGYVCALRRSRAVGDSFIPSCSRWRGQGCLVGRPLRHVCLICGGQPRDQVATRCPVERPLLMILRSLGRMAFQQAQPGSQRPAVFDRDQPVADPMLAVVSASAPNTSIDRMRGERPFATFALLSLSGPERRCCGLASTVGFGRREAWGRAVGVFSRLSNGIETGPPIGVQKGPLGGVVSRVCRPAAEP